MLLVVVASRRVLLWPQHGVGSPQHSTTHFHFLTFPLPGGGWCGLTRPAPARAPQRCTRRTLAQGSAPARSAEQPRRSAGTATPQLNTGTTLTTFTTFSLSLGRCTVGTQWMVLLLVGAVDGSISRIRSIRNMRLEVVRAIFVVISSTLFIRWSLLNESAAREATKKFDN